MKKDTTQVCIRILAMVTLLTVASCANTSDNRRGGQQGPPSMGGSSGGNRQGPPSGDRGDGPPEEPPEEAIAACVDKKSGDYVEFTLDNGKTIAATCVEHQDQLVAVPQEMMNQKN